MCIQPILTQHRQYYLLLAPKKELQSLINDYVVVFMDTIAKSRYEDTDHIFKALQKDELAVYMHGSELDNKAVPILAKSFSILGLPSFVDCDLHFNLKIYRIRQNGNSWLSLRPNFIINHMLRRQGHWGSARLCCWGMQ